MYLPPKKRLRRLCISFQLFSDCFDYFYYKILCFYSFFVNSILTFFTSFFRLIRVYFNSFLYWIRKSYLRSSKWRYKDFAPVSDRFLIIKFYFSLIRFRYFEIPFSHFPFRFFILFKSISIHFCIQFENNWKSDSKNGFFGVVCNGLGWFVWYYDMVCPFF